jgi:putative toxin-antitoxin system antitoxin component (TIGR02293 family)
MAIRTADSKKKVGVSKRDTKKVTGTIRPAKFSPSWVVMHTRDAPSYKLELIGRIRQGVKKSDWKQLIEITGSTEKEFEHILPTSISSMQKKSIYSKATSERIYELARLFGIGYEVFDTKEDFKKWLITPSKPLGGKAPFELLDSSFGFEMVENEIVRIQYNVYS